MTNLLCLFTVIILSTSSIHGQDWQNLGKYQQANEEVMLQTKNLKRVVFFGNSITESWPLYSPEFFSINEYIGRGISGQTTAQMIVRFRQDVVQLNADVVVILAGINDIAGNTGPMTLEQTADNIAGMIEIAQANNIEVLLCSVLPANHFPWQPKIDPSDKVILLNSMLKEFSSQYHITYVDYYSQMVDKEKGLISELGLDPVHPNQKGYEIMQTIISAYLKP